MSGKDYEDSRTKPNETDDNESEHYDGNATIGDIVDETSGKDNKDNRTDLTKTDDIVKSVIKRSNHYKENNNDSTTLKSTETNDESGKHDGSKVCKEIHFKCNQCAKCFSREGNLHKHQQDVTFLNPR